jgi:hypothetical protein
LNSMARIRSPAAPNRYEVLAVEAQIHDPDFKHMRSALHRPITNQRPTITTSEALLYI